MAFLGLATILACVFLAFKLPLDEAAVLWGQTWLLDKVGQALLAFVYVATAILLAIAATTERAQTVYAPILACAGLFSAVVLLRSQLLALLVLPAALVAFVHATYPAAPSAVRGASRFLAWATLPIPFLLTIPILLERFALFPDEVAWVNWSAWLMVPAWILWLTLFPTDGTTRLWADDGPPLAPAFLWAVKDWVVIYLLLSLWRQVPLLHTQPVAMVLGVAGLATAVVSGLWAPLQSSPSAVLACAAMSALGIALQGIMAGSAEGLQGGLTLLFSRSVAILLASSTLAAMEGTPAPEGEAQDRPLHWPNLVLSFVFVIVLLAMVGMPYLRGFLGPAYIHPTLEARMPNLLWRTWLVAAAGIVLGLLRVGWWLRREKLRAATGQVRVLPFLVVLCLVLLWLWLEVSPQLVWSRISELGRLLLP
jgi:hypothetical protein